MSANGDAKQPEVVEATPAAPAAGGAMNLEEALKNVLKKAVIHDGLVRGIREVVKSLDRQQAHICVLAESCDEKQYSKLIEALCAQNNIPLIKVSDGKKLGEWSGLCKLDKEGKPRKVVNASSVAITNFGEDSEAQHVILEHFKSKA